MSYTGRERRKHPRISNRFVVCYRLLQEQDKIETSQTKDLCIGGMLLTTHRQFEPGSSLVLEIRLPFHAHTVTLIAKVIESREVTKDLIYDTRLSFCAINEKQRKVIADTVNYYLKKG
ncbi:MAG: PilZ domain-containing protein [Candidatus Omnitrophica bacterium]|nr:PilZ domain-containing protein [Candidatus Omnitrophota bacterium]